MYKKIINAILVIVCLTAIVSLGVCMSEEQRHENARSRIARITLIEVPIESKVLFHYTPKEFANGRPEQLTVFKFDTEPTEWLKEKKFLRSDDETLVNDEGDSQVGENENYFLTYFKNETKNGQKVPQEYVPNFEIPYLWVDRGIYNDYFFYYPETLMLIVYIAWS